MIEADIQLAMRVFLGGRMNDKVENDNVLSKCNHGSRKGSSKERGTL